MTRAEAITFLARRYAEQAERYPRVAGIPVGLYVSRNLPAAMRMTLCGTCQRARILVDGTCPECSEADR